jgi:hypothetical protein
MYSCILNVHVYVLIILMILKLISSIPKSITFIKLYKNAYVFTIWLFYITSAIYKSEQLIVMLYYCR